MKAGFNCKCYVNVYFTVNAIAHAIAHGLMNELRHDAHNLQIFDSNALGCVHGADL